ncbi:MAG TPA: flagellar motor switch protein FliG [Desulfobacteria bacterium]|nr:flagellar motor switch protein FliG [Desulfobacteria bacterium]
MGKNLSGQQKAAVLMIALGPENSAQVIQHLSEAEIERLTVEMAHLRKVSTDERDEVMDEFYHMYLASDYAAQGGLDYAREVLERALGEQRAFEIIGKLSSALKMRPFDLVRRTDPKQLLSFIQGEHPQTIALIISHLPAEKGATLLSGLPQNLQADVARRIALMGRTSPEVLKEVENILEQKISGLAPADYANYGGISSIVNLLNNADPGTFKTVMENLEQEDPELAEQIRLKLFVFDDIVLLDDRSIQLVLREVDAKELGLALKGANPDVAKKIQANMSTRAAAMLREDMEYMGPVRVRDVERAQQGIIKIIRKLEECGSLVVPRSGSDDLVY